MRALDVDSLLAPVSADSECGIDLSADADFVMLESAAQVVPEKQYGDTVIPARQPDWVSVLERACVLSQRTRDLRLAVLITRAAARVEGLQGYLAGLQVIHAWLERYWPGVYPLLDAAEHDDPIERLNALAALCDPEAGLADLRAARIGKDRAACRVADVEAASLTTAAMDEARREQALAPLKQTVAASAAVAPGLAEALRGVHDAVGAIELSLGQKAPGMGPDWKALRRVLKPLAALAPGAAPGSVAEEGGSPRDGEAAYAASGLPKGERTRADVLRELDGVCLWFERHEPSHPAPLLIRRAQRLVQMNFMEIIRDMVPDGIEHVERLAGRPPS